MKKHRDPREQSEVVLALLFGTCFALLLPVFPFLAGIRRKVPRRNYFSQKTRKDEG